MRAVIAGGGNVGYYLVKTLCENKHRVSVIDRNMERCVALDGSDFGRKINVTCGDATVEQTLKEAGAEHCDVFIAVTGQDQNNLTACMLAKERMGAKRTITRVNNPKNVRIFQQLGVDSVISSAARIADMIEQEVDWNEINSILAEKTVNARIRQFVAAAGSGAAGRKVSELRLPEGLIIVLVVRGQQAFIPNGASGLEAGDVLMIMGPSDRLDQIGSLFMGGRPR